MAKDKRGSEDRTMTKADVVRDETVQDYKHQSTATLQMKQAAFISEISCMELEMSGHADIIARLQEKRAFAKAQLAGIETLIASRG